MQNSVAMPEGFGLRTYESLGSTNDEARRLAEEGISDGTVIWSLEQTKGRGRHGRDWVSPQGNLYSSIVLRDVGPLAQAAQLSMVAAVALGEAVSEYLPDPKLLGFKWPNDLLLERRKLCGVLLESGTDRSGSHWVIIGAGVNVTNHPPEDAVMFPATDLAEAGAEVSLEDLLARYVAALAEWRRRWQTQGLAPVRAAWLSRAAGVGETVSVRMADGSRLEGRFLDVDADGALQVEGADGRPVSVSAGDVFFG